MPAVLLLVTNASAMDLPPAQGVCAAPDAPTVEVPASGTAADVIARLPAPACFGGTLEVSVVPGVPLASADAGPGWTTEHPLLVDLRLLSVSLSRWPEPGVATDDPALARRLVRVDRMAYASRRRVGLVVAEDTKAADIADWLGFLQRTGYSSAFLALLPEPDAEGTSWVPPRPATFEAPPIGPVRAPETVVISSEGDFTLQFPVSYGVRPIEIPRDDIEGFELACAAGSCELLLLADGGRYLVQRGPEPAADDLVRIWAFGVPVGVWEGPSLGGLRTPTTQGRVTPLPVWRWLDTRSTRRGDMVRVFSRRANLTADPCIHRAIDAWRVFRPAKQNPFGRVGLDVTVGPDGVVTDVKLPKTEILNEQVVACIVDAAWKTRMPRPADGKPYEVKTGYTVTN